MKDPVTPDLRRRVLRRDRQCVAVIIDPRIDQCQRRFGQPCQPTDPLALTLDHVQEGYGRMGKRAPSTASNLVSLCWHHHLDGWATSHRPELRAYLARVGPAL